MMSQAGGSAAEPSVVMATPGRAEGLGGLRRGPRGAAGLDPVAGTPPGTMSYLTVPPATGASMERPPRAEAQPPGHAGLPLPHPCGTSQQQRKPRAGRAPALARPCQRLSVLLRGAGRRLAQLLQGLRQHSRHITRSVLFRLGVVVVVCVHTLMLVAQTFAAIQIRGEWFFSVLDAVFLCVYVVEALVKLAAFGLDYFRDPWNDIDFLVMGLMLLDFTLPLVVLPGNAWFEDGMSLLRLLRIFKGVRAFRLVHLMLSLRALESLQELAGTFALSGRSIGAILLLMFTCLFIFSVLLRDLFARSDPGRFGHLLDTVFTLFQLLTLDDWSFIYRDSAQQGASYIIIFLMAYILIEYFTFLNLVIAVLVDNFQMSLIRRQELKKRTQRLQLQESVSDSGPTGKLLPPPSSGRAELGVGGWVSVPCWGYARGVMAPQSWTRAWGWLRTTSGWRSWWSGWRAARGRSSCSWVTSGAWPRSSGCSRSSGPGQPRPTTLSTPSSRRPSRTSCATEGPGCQDDP